MRLLTTLAVLACLAGSSFAQARFDVASIRPANESIPFEKDGLTSLSHGTLRMRDISIRGCIAFAYGVSNAQIAGPAALNGQRYDITAEAPATASESEVRTMMQALLAERFHLALHHEPREMRGYILSVYSPPKDPARFHPSAEAGEVSHQNSATGTTARNISMRQFADFLSGPLDGPVADQTNLSGAYDLNLDFTPYVDLAAKPADLPTVEWVLNSALKGELGLQIVARKASFDAIVVDHVEALTPN